MNALDDEEKRTSVLGGAQEAPQGQIPGAGPTGRPVQPGVETQTTPPEKSATGGGTPASAIPQKKDEPTAAQPAAPPSPTAGMTFAQMQAAGYARPAPPPPPAPAPAVGGGGNPQIQAALAQLMGQPTAYDNAAMMNEFKQGAQGIEDTYNKNKTATDEEMARRGIFDSTIAGGRLHDLNIGKRSAETQLMSDLATKRAGAYDAGIRSALASAMGYEQQGTQADIARADLAGRAEDRALNREQMMRRFGLDERQADLAEKLGLSDLALRQSGQAFSQNIQTRQLTNEEKAQAHAMGLSDQQFLFQKERAGADDAWRNRQLTSQEQMEARRMGLSEEQFKQQKYEFEQNYGLNQNSQLMNLLTLLAQQFFPGQATGSANGAPAAAPVGSGGGGGAAPWGGGGSPAPWDSDIYRV